jgi:hypothetical protein
MLRDSSMAFRAAPRVIRGLAAPANNVDHAALSKATFTVCLKTIASRT